MIPRSSTRISDGAEVAARSVCESGLDTIRRNPGGDVRFDRVHVAGRRRPPNRTIQAKCENIRGGDTGCGSRRSVREAPAEDTDVGIVEKHPLDGSERGLVTSCHGCSNAKILGRYRICSFLRDCDILDSYCSIVHIALRKNGDDSRLFFHRTRAIFAGRACEFAVKRSSHGLRTGESGFPDDLIDWHIRVGEQIAGRQQTYTRYVVFKCHSRISAEYP